MVREGANSFLRRLGLALDLARRLALLLLLELLGATTVFHVLALLLALAPLLGESTFGGLFFGTDSGLLFFGLLPLLLLPLLASAAFRLLGGGRSFRNPLLLFLFRSNDSSTYV